MLHLFSLMWGLLGTPVVDACELSSMPVVDVATHRHERQLRECIERRSVWLRAFAIRDPRLRIPGSAGKWVGAIRVEQSRLLSSHGLAAGYRVENSMGEPVSPIAVYPKKGLALFEGVSLSKDVVIPTKNTINVGRVFFAVDRSSKLVRLAVLGKGAASLGYYWLTNAQLPIGTPVYTGRAEFVSIVGLNAPDGRSLLLPTEAFDTLDNQKGMAVEP